MMRYCVATNVSHHMNSSLVRNRPQRRSVPPKESVNLSSFEQDLQRAIQESLKDFHRIKKSLSVNVSDEKVKKLQEQSTEPLNYNCNEKLVPNKKPGKSLKTAKKNPSSSRSSDSIAINNPCLRSQSSILSESTSSSQEFKLKKQATDTDSDEAFKISKRPRIEGRRKLRSDRSSILPSHDKCSNSCASPSSLQPLHSNSIPEYVDLSDGEISMRLNEEDAKQISSSGALFPRRVTRSSKTLQSSKVLAKTNKNVPFQNKELSGADSSFKVCKRSATASLEKIEVPSWRLNPLSIVYSMESTENLDDEVFEKRHHKHELNEKKRKRWDRQLQHDQEMLERARQKEQQRLERHSPLKSMFPTTDTVRSLELTEDTPVTMFRYPLDKLPIKDFYLPWVSIDDLRVRVHPEPAIKKRASAASQHETKSTTQNSRGSATKRQLRSSRHKGRC